jgi:hypothetical protein
MVSARKLTILCLLIGLGGQANAHPAEVEAEREFRIGYQSLRSGNCSEALVHYRRSLELAQRPRTLFNIATCEEELGRESAAWNSYQSFLALAEERDAAIVVEARARLDALRKRLRGSISVESNPPGATVTVDGERQARGETPVTVRIEPGRHVVRVSMPGAVAVERTVEVAPDDLSSVRVELALASAISIRTEPADASIESEQEGALAIGRFDQQVAPGRHVFTIRRDGYRDERVVVDATAGHTHEIRINLRPEPVASTLVVTKAAGATLRIDGKAISLSQDREVHELPVGDHEVSLQRGAQVVWRRGLQFSPGEIVRIDVDAPSRPSTTRRALTWTIGGLGVASITAGGVVGTLALRDVTSEQEDVHGRGKTRALVADGLFVAGAAALVVAWRLMHGDHRTTNVYRENGAL